MEQLNWDDRYSDADYVYGTEPNSFLVEHASKLCGPVLSLAEGEGRNAVYLATLGLEVLGVDGSSVGLQKAQMLAQAKGVSIQTQVVDLSRFEPEPSRYGAVVSIFAHLPSNLRGRLYPMIERSLKEGGLILLESYSVRQLRHETGGPKDADMLMTTEKIQQEFPNVEQLLLREVEREIIEGKYHTGLASVIQFIGRKNY